MGDEGCTLLGQQQERLHALAGDKPGMVRGLILPLCALFPPPQAQPPVSQGMLSSSVPQAMPSMAGLSMNPGLVCPHHTKGDTPQPPGKRAEPVMRCSYRHYPRGAWHSP